MDVCIKILKSGLFGIRELKKKYMILCVIIRIYWGGYSWYRTGRDKAVKENERVSFFIVFCKLKWGVLRQIGIFLGGYSFEYCFFVGRGFGNNIRLF